MKARLAMFTAVALLMWGAKRYYADAAVDDLRWILGPTARLVTATTGVPFEQQAAEGYFSRERLFLIEKACAGVNFMIAAFGMIAWVLRRRVSSLAAAAAVIAASVAASFCAAVIANAARIAVAIWLAGNRPPIRWMGAADIHRIEGIVVYFGGLVLLHELARLFDGGHWCSARLQPSVKGDANQLFARLKPRAPRFYGV